MDFFKRHHHILATTIFVLSIVVAHIFSTDGYDWTQNTISELGAQGYRRKLILQVGFLAFGITLTLGILINGLSWRATPILIYGLCVALTGVFCTKPFIEIASYSGAESTIHSALAQVAGFAFSMGILTQLFFTPETNLKWIHLAFFVLVIGLSATFGLLDHSQGIVQRLLYAASFVWLIGYYKP
ncbi:MAG: hypothetical protein RLZZ519_3486 [Bacteroidota bacterium]|jgi:hypothetical protein